MFTSNEMRDYQHTLDSIYFGTNIKDELTLSKWCDRTRVTAQAVKVVQDELNNRWESEKHRFSTAENNRRWESLQVDRGTYEDIARAKIEKDLDSVLDAKRTAFSKAMSAPDEKSLRLLQTLQMRKNLTAAEISATAEHLSGNLQALSVLSEIAATHGIAFPRLNTDFLSTEAEVRDAVRTLLDNLFSDELTYPTMTFLHEAGMNGPLRPYVDALDSPAWLACDTSQIQEMSTDENITLEGDENNEQTKSSFASVDVKSDF